MTLHSFDIWTQKLVVSPYCRVSTDKDDQKNSLESQIKYFKELINSRPNWTLGEIFYDEGITGTSTKKRKNFNRLIADAMSGKVQFIITKEVSRFARNTVDTLVLTRKLKDCGVGVYFVLDNINTLDSDGELRLTIMASLAQEESRKTSERVKWGQQRRMEQGVVFGRDMLGYNVKGGKMTVNEEEAPVVREIFSKFLEGKGCGTIARELASQGLKPKRVKQWTNTTILKVLYNEKYVGDLCQKKTYTPDYLTHDKKYNKDKSSMVYIKNHHEPIIKREIWDTVRQELARRALTDTKKTKHATRYWCSGKIICEECGNKFLSRVKKLKNESTYKAWRCLSANREGAKKVDFNGNVRGCNSPQINENIFLHCVREAKKLVQTNDKLLINEILSEIKSVSKLPDIINVKPLQLKINEFETRKNKIIDLVLQGLITNDDLKKQLKYYDGEIESLTKLINEANSATKNKSRQKDEFESYIKEINKITEFGFENTLLYREALDCIKVYNDKTLIVYFHCIPFGVKFKFTSKGKLNNYTAIIENIEVVII